MNASINGCHKLLGLNIINECTKTWNINNQNRSHEGEVFSVGCLRDEAFNGKRVIERFLIRPSMQSPGSSVKSVPEPLQFDCGSNSNTSDMDQSFYRGNMLLNSIENPTLADFLLSRNDGSMDFLNMVPQGTDGLSIWNSRDIASSDYIASQENHDENKMDNGWNTSLSINSGGGPSTEERNCERSNIMSLENVDLNLNNSPADDGQVFTQRLSSSHMINSQEHNLHAGSHSSITEVSLCPFLPEFFEPDSNSNGSLSNTVEQSWEDNGRTRSSIDGRRTACKRKNMEGVIGESSTSHNISADLSMPSSSRYLPSTSSLDENVATNFSPMNRGVPSGWYPSSSISVTGCLLFGCLLNHSVQLLLLSSTEQSQHHVQPFPGVDDLAYQHPSSSRFGSSSSAAYSNHRFVASPEETNAGSLPRNAITDQRTFPTRTAVDGLVQDSPNWNPSSSRASSSSGVMSLPGSSRASSETFPVQFHTYLSDIVQSTLFPSVGSESGHRNANLSSRHSGRSAATQEPGQSPRAGRRGHSPLHLRTAAPLDRLRDSVSSLPLSTRSREGRSRMISEDIFIFDRSGFYGRADLYDRHRDLRLDVDNMSYEELLALEERIGNVSTGLDEDTILKCLRRRKYSSCKLEVASTEEEPCCICREEYGEGEDIGALDCKHDFHVPCIKQWLMIKNVCPICKTTAVVT
ncbi:hypothetical protein HPP92_015282 [Vanilla planifolia]|uniref:RING-type E3 ubiquitin transferase n=1 Tax=Vanilla planifolia TaxID=51239 RepID=A0A835UUY4_VANPL|nr:hypothetical protein HPP92_015282 [Vanilla planifolia]